MHRPDLDPTRIVVFGRSLGGAVGSALVKSNPGKVLRLISTTYFMCSVVHFRGALDNLPLSV